MTMLGLEHYLPLVVSLNSHLMIGICEVGLRKPLGAT